MFKDLDVKFSMTVCYLPMSMLSSFGYWEYSIGCGCPNPTFSGYDTEKNYLIPKNVKCQNCVNDGKVHIYFDN